MSVKMYEITESRLEALPPELFLVICELVLCSPEPLATYPGYDHSIQRTDLSLLGVSRRIRRFTLPIFWEKNTFEIFAPPYPTKVRLFAFRVHT
jgi:hypothetical protein